MALPLHISKGYRHNSATQHVSLTNIDVLEFQCLTKPLSNGIASHELQLLRIFSHFQRVQMHNVQMGPNPEQKQSEANEQ